MMNRRVSMLGCAVLLVAFTAGLQVFAVPPPPPTVHFVDLGTALPPTFLGPVAVNPISESLKAVVPASVDVTTVPLAPFAGTPLLHFDSPLMHLVVPSSWNNWSHGYTGSVYFLASNGGPSRSTNSILPTGPSVTMTLPPHTQAFYFYTEANSYDTFDFFATTDTGLTVGPISITTPFGAHGFGFYADPGASITSIMVQETADNSFGFAIGEFGMNLNGFPTWLSFQDDYYRSSFCVNNLTGEYMWNSCYYPPGAAVSNGGCISMGFVQVLNSATLFKNYPQDPTLIYLTYDPLAHRAKGYRYYGSYSALMDMNTANNPPCGGRPTN